MAIEQSRISNALGVPVPQWLIKQLDRRSAELSRATRDTDNIRFQGNRTSWVRMVSSVDIVKDSAKNYFRNMGLDITDPSSLSKLFVLQGGVTVYEGNDMFGSGFRTYRQRNGFSEAYNVAGPNEINTYGYRPMPGINSVRVQTQGKLGSIRSADIQLKVWDKSQLDIIDALYFKLGYSMFIEWGHTYYYDNDGVLKSSEELSLDPFSNNLTKEDILNQISNNVNKSKGNYDAMLGVVTNFNFSYNQEGGYDCTIKLMALGSLISTMKMNNPRILPDLSEDVVKLLVNTLIKEEERRQALLQQQANVSTGTTTTTTTEKPTLAIDYYKKYFKYDESNKTYKNQGNVFTNYPSTQKYRFPENSNFNVITPAYSQIFFIKKLNGFIVQSRDDFKLKIDNQFFKSIISKNKINLLDPEVWDDDDIVLAEFQVLLGTAGFLGQAARFIGLIPKTDFNLEYTGDNLGKYNLDINRDMYAYIDQDFGSNVEVSTAQRFIRVSDEEFSKKLMSIIASESANNYPFELSLLPAENNRVTPRFKVTTFTNIDVPIEAEVSTAVGAADVKTEKKIITAKARLNFSISFNDTDLLKSFTSPRDVLQPVDFKSYEAQVAANTPPPPQPAPPPPPEPPLKVSDIQTTEALKYQSAFEVMVRTLQLYSLDQAIKSQIDVDKKVRTLNLTDKNIYDTFTKDLFSVGIFANMMDNLVDEKYDIKKLCEDYDKEVQASGTMANKEDMLKLRSLFGFHFGLMGNNSTATDLLKKECNVVYKNLLKTYIVPYEFNTGVFEGTQVNHPVYLPLGLVLMILNHVCGIYDSNGKATFSTPLVYVDFNPVSNLCLSNAKHLSTNPYDILIPFQGQKSDYESILDPSVLQKGKNGQLEIKPTSGSTESTPLFDIRDNENGDLISGGLNQFKLVTGDNVETYRGRTMNILVSADYLLKVVASYSKNNGSGDIYFKEFIEQILFDINKYLGDVNLFRLAYNDSGNTAHVVDDQYIPNLEGIYATENKTMFPLFGSGSIARNIEIRTDISTKLNNMLAIAANSNYKDQSALSKNGDSVGFYNLAYRDRYIPFRGEFTSSVNLPTDTMINSAIQFNKAIETFYSDAKPAESSVAHATNYYIERMSKIKGEEKGTRASAMIPVSLNFSVDGISGLGMGHAFTIPQEFLPYNYDLSLTDPFGEKDQQNTVGFVAIGLDQTIEANQWISNIRANMIYLKKREDFVSQKVEKLDAPTKGLTPASVQSTVVGKADLSQLNVNQSWENIAFNFIAAKEGFIERPKNDEGTLRAGYGTDKIVLADGTIKSVGSDTVFTREDGKRTLIYQIQSDYSKRVIRKIGEQAWTSLNDRQKAALVSFAYNVGSINNSIASAIKANSGPNIVASAIAEGPYTGAQSGFLSELKKRRQLEATLYLS